MCWNYRAYHQQKTCTKRKQQLRTCHVVIPPLSPCSVISLSLSLPVTNFTRSPRTKSTPDSGFAMFAASGRSVKIRMSSYGNSATCLVDPPTKTNDQMKPQPPGDWMQPLLLLMLHALCIGKTSNGRP